MSRELPEPASRAVQVVVFGSSAVLAAGLGGVPLEGQLAAGVAAGLSPTVSDYLNRGLARIGQRWGRNADAAVQEAAASAQREVDELVERLTATPARQELLAAAVEAAARAVLEPKIKALGRSLAIGALTSDEAEVDTELLFARAMADIEAPHLRLLQVLEAQDPSQPPFTHELAELTGLHQTADAVLATLQRHGLARQVPNRANQLGEAWRMTPFGSDLLSRLRAVGTPDAGGDQGASP